MPPYPRNPKVARFTLSVDVNINRRLEAVADKLGQNKATIAGVLMALGLNVVEPVLQLGLDKYVDQAVEEKTAEVSDLLQGLKSENS